MLGLRIRLFNPPIVPIFDFGYLATKDIPKIAERFAYKKVTETVDGSLIKSATEVMAQNVGLLDLRHK